MPPGVEPFRQGLDAIQIGELPPDIKTGASLPRKRLLSDGPMLLGLSC
ncbi:MAG: hypothetical protein AAGB26_04555 [Planctomycetota bacterium]